MKKLKILMLLSILCLLIIIPTSFAAENETILAEDVSIQNTSIASEDTDTLASDIYFDAGVEKDGDGSWSNPYKNLKIEYIKENSIVYLSDGEYKLNELLEKNNLTIIGSNPSKTIIKNFGIETSGYLCLKNLTLINCEVSTTGTLKVVNSIFNNPTRGYNAIYSSTSSSSTTIDNCTFSNEYRLSQGGAIKLIDGNLTITNSQFNGNYASEGGAIYVDKGTLLIRNSQFISNYADKFGGSICAKNNANLTITQTTILNGYSIDDAGGAIYLKNSNLESDYLEITNCTSTFGGAIVSLSSSLKLNNFVSKNNRAKYNGGSIYIMYNTFYLEDSTFESNYAQNGGAIFVDEVYDFIASGNKFMSNEASNTGGAVYSVIGEDYIPISVIDSAFENTFINNKALFEPDAYEANLPELFVGDGNYILVKLNTSYDGNLPSSYDLRTFGQVSPVKNQGSGGNCWAFNTIAALESCILKATGKTYDLSEENMKNLMYKFSDYGWAMEPNIGGYDKMSVSYLTAWLGPINETDDPYDPNSELSSLFKSFFHVQNVVYLTRTNYTENDEIKRAIMDYGAVATSIYWSSTYLGKDRKSYYCPNELGGNHAITIVGWDDNYSKENFAKVVNNKPLPPGDGAWIIKNSWGTDNSGDKGFYYVSYYDKRCAQLNKPESTYTFILNDTIKFDKNYQYDIPGKSDYFFNKTYEVWYKNIFKATDDEYLAAVSTYFNKQCNWEFYIYVNNVSKAFKSGSAGSSYKTINLDEIIPLKVGDIFEIVFKISGDSDVSVPISESVSFMREFYRENISFVSYDGKKWHDLCNLDWTYPNHTYSGQVACIKAFTFLNEIRTVINLTVEHVEDNKVDITARITDEFGNAIENGSVIFTVDNKDYSTDITDGKAALSNILLKTGINEFTVKFSKTGYADSIKSINVASSLISTSLTLNFSSSKYNPLTIDAIVKDNDGNMVKSGEVVFNVEDEIFSVDVVNGVASLTHVFRTMGINNISASYSDLYCYNSSSCEESVTIHAVDSTISLNVNGKHNPITITANVCDDRGMAVESGVVTFILNGVSYDVDVEGGIASLDHVFTSFGRQEIKASYFDSSYYYTSCSIKDYFDVSLKKTVVELNVESGNVVNPVNIICTVKDSDGKLVERGEVTFNIDNEIKTMALTDGKADLSYVFEKMGINEISVNYKDSYYYDVSSKVISLNVTKIKIDLNVNVLQENDDYKVTVDLSQPINEYVDIYVNEKYNTVKSVNGRAILYLNDLLPGSYKVNASVRSNAYCSDVEEVTFKVNEIPTVISCGDVFYYNSTISCPVTLKDNKGNFVSDCFISASINGKTYGLKTNAQGVAFFKFNLDVGEYSISILFNGTSRYVKSSLDKNITVKSTILLPATSRYTYNSYYKATLYDEDGKPLDNENVLVTVKKDYDVVTNAKGLLSFKIDLTRGNYLIKVTNLLTGEEKTQSISVVNRLVAGGLAMYFGTGKYYKVRAYDDNGNVAKGVKVAINFNGKIFYRYTDSNGYASLKISAKVGTYTVTSTYKNFKVSSKVIVKPRLITKNMIVKKSGTFSYAVKLLSTSGKVLKYQKIVVKFKGKTYSARTSTYGIAIFKIKVNSKIGSFYLTTSYGSLRNINKITIK